MNLIRLQLYCISEEEEEEEKNVYVFIPRI